MTSTFDRTVSQAIDQLRRLVSLLNRPADLHGLLAVHFDVTSRLHVLFTWDVYVNPVDWSNKHANSLHDAPKLAVLGCLLSECQKIQGYVEPHVLTVFESSVRRLTHRKKIFQFSHSWIWQTDVVLGITLGIRAAQRQDLSHWMLQILDEGISRPNAPILPKLTFIYAAYLLGRSNPVLWPKATINSYHHSIAELALIIWLIRREVLAEGGENESQLEVLQARLLERLLIEQPYEAEDYKAAVILEVLLSYIEARAHLPTHELVIKTLENFLPAMERWKPKWAIKDEYDIQTILWLILRVLFNNLRYEEYLPKLGRSGQRYDLGIPELGLLIEVKYIRRASDFQKIIDEVGKDSNQLLPQSQFNSIIVFAYDESCIVENHEWTRRTLESIPFVKKAVIVPAPFASRSVNGQSA